MISINQARAGLRPARAWFNKVILVCLPPHTTHETQPLDTSVFRSLKRNWSEECHNSYSKNPGRVITKYDFSALLNTVWGKTMLPNVISAGFKQSGIYPFNPQAIDYGAVTKKSSDTPGKEIFKAKKGCPVRGTVNGVNKTLNLSHEQVQLFEKRYEEGYDSPDPLYLKWLKINHPKQDQTGDQERSILEDEELGFSAEQE